MSKGSSPRARIIWKRADDADLKGARAVEIDIEAIGEIAGRGPLGWRFLDYSPFNPRYELSSPRPTGHTPQSP